MRPEIGEQTRISQVRENGNITFDAGLLGKRHVPQGVAAVVGHAQRQRAILVVAGRRAKEIA